jgi:hypothetical protein
MLCKDICVDSMSVKQYQGSLYLEGEKLPKGFPFVLIGLGIYILAEAYLVMQVSRSLGSKYIAYFPIKLSILVI